MKKFFSFLTAILFAGSMMAADPAAAGTTLFSEDFSGYAKDAVPSGTVTTATGRVVYGDASVTYTSQDNGTNKTKIYTENLAGGESPELLVGKSGGVFTIADIPSGGAKEITVSFKQNAQKLTVSLTGTGYSTDYDSPKPKAAGEVSFDVTVADDADATFGIVMTSGSSNVRVDDILVSVKTAGTASQGGGETTSTVKTIYCKNAQSWWFADGATVGIYAFKGETVKNAAWPGVRMTAVEGETNLWKADIDTAKYEKIIFVRVSGTGDIADYGAQTEDLAVPADKDLYTITSTSAQWSGEGNKVTGTWSVYTSQGGDDPVVEEPAVIKLHGNFSDGTNWANTDAFTLSEDKKTATLKLTLNKGNYEFGMRIGADDNWTSNGVAFTRENKSAVVAAGTGNLTLAADTKGDYTFTWTYATNTLAIDFPEYVETLPEMQIAGAWDVKDNAWVKNAMTPAEDKKTASYEVELKAGDYEFKVIKDGAWLAKANEGNAYGLHREWTGVAGVVDQNTLENLKLTADVDGKYTFVWTFANDSLGVVFPAKPAELQAVSAATTWDFSKITANTGNALYNKEGIQLTDASTPNKNDEMVYANYSADFMTFAEGFDAATMAFKGEYPIRKNQYCQAGTLHFKTTVAGTITVKFSDTGSSASTTAVKRYLVVNGEQTEYWTSRGNNSTDEDKAHAAQLNVTSGEIAVPAGDVTITGSSAIVVYTVTFTPEAPAKFYITGNEALLGEKAWNPAAIKVTEDSYTFENLAAGDYKLKVTLDGTWNDGMVKGFDALTQEDKAGLTADKDNNICFTLAEAGNVTVTYTPETFTVTGNFYVAPVEPTAKFYITGSANLVGEENEWQPNAIPVMEDSKVLALEAGDYMLKLTMNGTWEGENNVKGYDALTGEIPAGVTRGTGNNDDNICFTLAEAGNVTVTYSAEAFTIEGDFYVAPVEEGCDWENIEFLGDGSPEQTFGNQFKVCKEGNVPNVVNIQKPDFAAETGIYVTFPSAAFGEISLAEGQYVINGAGMVLYLSAFTARETEVSVVCEGNTYVFTVYNAKASEPVVEHTYTVAGSSEIAFGTTWDPENAANDMAKQEDGTYKWEKAELTLAAGPVQFKVCEDHAWDVAYPAENYQLPIAEAGIYTITITFDPATQTVAANAVKTGSAEVDPTVSVKGSWDEWANELVFVLAEDKQSATLTVNNIATGLYEFKVILNGGDWRSNSHVFTREAASSEGITGNDEANMKLLADVEGEYTFTWTFATNSLAIEFPEGGIIPEPVLADGYYLVGDFNDWEPAAEYLFAANEGAEGEFILTTTLAGATELKVVYVVADQKVTWFGANNYQIPEELRREVNIYFRPEANAAWTALDGHLYIEKDIQTGIDPVEVDPNAPALKVLHNGQLLIIKGDRTYNVMGTLVR